MATEKEYIESILVAVSNILKSIGKEDYKVDLAELDEDIWVLSDKYATEED